MIFELSKHVFNVPELPSMVDKAIEFFAQSPLYELPPPGPFWGGGVYALYYRGDNEVYVPLVNADQGKLILPIYVGKAVPEGSRTGFKTAKTTRKLYARLMEHTRSIQAASANLRSSDFHCRFIIMDGATADLIVPVEAELIRRQRPVWNWLGGFGNHVVGVNRKGGMRAEWDVLHPGRSGAALSAAEQGRLEKVLRKIRAHFESQGFLNSTTAS